MAGVGQRTNENTKAFAHEQKFPVHLCTADFAWSDKMADKTWPIKTHTVKWKNVDLFGFMLENDSREFVRCDLSQNEKAALMVGDRAKEEKCFGWWKTFANKQTVQFWEDQSWDHRIRRENVDSNVGQNAGKLGTREKETWCAILLPTGGTLPQKLNTNLYFFTDRVREML